MVGRYARIVAALDGGATRRLVAERALEVAESCSARLLFVHVLEATFTEADATDFERLYQRAELRLREDLADLLAIALESPKIPSCDLEVHIGRPVSVLLDRVAKENSPDLLICGDRGLSNLKQVLMGSVSSALVRNLECDVLVVRMVRN